MKNSLDRNLIAGKEYIRESVTAHEGAFLTQLAGEIAQSHRENPAGVATIVEIGSWIGVSTVYLARGASRGLVFAVDPHENTILHKNQKGPDTEAFLRENLEIFGVKPLVHVIKQTSMDALKDWHSPIDFLYIDGSHYFKDVRADFAGWAPFVRYGGILAFHDYPTRSGVKRTVDEMVRTAGHWGDEAQVQKLIAFRRLS